MVDGGKKASRQAKRSETLHPPYSPLLISLSLSPPPHPPNKNQVLYPLDASHFARVASAVREAWQRVQRIERDRAGGRDLPAYREGA